MKNSIKTGIGIFILGLGILVNSCVKDDPDAPPKTTIPFDPDKVLTIADIKIIKDTTGSYTFTDIHSFYAVVGMDEKSGNIYKSAYVQDETGGIQLNFLNAGGLYLGDSIRFMLQGSTVDDYGGLYQINNLDVGRSVVKMATQKFIVPNKVTIDELNNNMDKYQSTVIQLDSVEFASHALGSTYADSVNKETGEVDLVNCAGTSIIVRTSGYANFANHTVAEGNGSLVAIFTKYNTTAQLVLREVSEVDLYGERCTGGGGGTIDPVPSLDEDFESAGDGQNINLDGWTNVIISGDRMWQGKFFENDNNTYAQATGYGSGLSDMETWLITPPVINTSGDKILSFQSGMAFWVHTTTEPLEVLASIDYDGSNFEDATWTALSPTLANAGSGNYNFVASGDVSLTNFTGNVAIAFRYQGSESETTSSIIDDVMINTGGGSGTTILSENFNEHWGGWETISLQGAQVWERDNDNGPDGSPCARMSGYEAGSFANDDWLISPDIDLSGYSSSTLVFESARNYDGDPIVVKISSNYTSDPASATWTTLPATNSESNWVWIGSGNVDISDFAGQMLNIAFQYTSNNQLSATWEVDNIVVKAD